MCKAGSQLLSVQTFILCTLFMAMPSVLFRGMAMGDFIGVLPSVVLGVLGLPQQRDAVHLPHL